MLTPPIWYIIWKYDHYFMLCTPSASLPVCHRGEHISKFRQHLLCDTSLESPVTIYSDYVFTLLGPTLRFALPVWGLLIMSKILIWNYIEKLMKNIDSIYHFLFHVFATRNAFHSYLFGHFPLNCWKKIYVEELNKKKRFDWPNNGSSGHIRVFFRTELLFR